MTSFQPCQVLTRPADPRALMLRRLALRRYAANLVDRCEEERHA